MTVLTTDGWQVQWRRVQRGFAKLGAEHNNTELYDDDLFHFFQDAWHLKDWIRNDPAAPHGVRGRVESEAAKVRALRIAADVANGSKHMTLDKHKRVNARLTGRNAAIAFGEHVSHQERVLTLDGVGGDTQITAEEVAAQVMEQWPELLVRLGLISRPPDLA